VDTTHRRDRPARAPWLIPVWVAGVLAAAGVLLVPWATYLFVTLPPDYTANHWWLAWGGYDVALFVVLIVTAVAVVRRSAYVPMAATIAGTLLVCDVWFYVLTARGTRDIVQAVAGAALVEIPLAVLCFWMAANFVRAIEVLRPLLQAAGFTVRDRRLVPPDADAASARMPDAADDAGGT
jgi:hypothetical protein